ncbi:MAG: hypothetical protein AAF547_09135 [Actinomycetota bacterium]
MLLDRLGLWPARAIWLLAPLTIGAALAQVLESEASTPALIVEISLWIAWFAVLVATLAPSPRSLTIIRVIAPAAFAALLLVGLSGHWNGTTLLGLGWAALFTAVVFLPTVGDGMINGSAYGSERRMALRPPAFVLLGPAQLAWLLAFAGLVTWAVLVLAERYVLAGLAAAGGVVAVWASTRILHQLSRRWIVFVPAGFVIHDPVLLVDSVLFRRNEVTALGPALDPLATTGGDRSTADHPGYHDLSAGALGLALEVVLRDPTPVTIRERGQARIVELDELVFTPTLPGAMLREARIRGLKIAAADS